MKSPLPPLLAPARRPALAAAACALLLTTLLGCSKAQTAPPGAGLADNARAILERYEKVRAALAADDLGTAKFQAGELVAALGKPEAPAETKALAAPAETISKSSQLPQARDAFKLLSASAIALAGSGHGYFVVNCPMTPNGDWLQTNDKVSNPYFGRAMADCGVVKK